MAVLWAPLQAEDVPGRLLLSLAQKVPSRESSLAFQECTREGN